MGLFGGNGKARIGGLFGPEIPLFGTHRGLREAGRVISEHIPDLVEVTNEKGKTIANLWGGVNIPDVFTWYK